MLCTVQRSNIPVCGVGEETEVEGSLVLMDQNWCVR